MNVSKNKALELVDEQIGAFEKLLAKATCDIRHDEDYSFAIRSAEALIAKLFPDEGSVNFRPRPSTFQEGSKGHQDHIRRCVTRFKVYRKTIENFWSDELANERKENIVPFVAMSFDNSDREINQYITGLLEALGIEFRTGEQYSKDSIPEKVQSRIRGSDLFIAIFVKRDKIEGGGYTTPSWLLKELGIAQGAGKDVIALVERDIKDIGGLDYEKEVVYFERDNPTEIEKATIKLLEAFKEHRLV